MHCLANSHRKRKFNTNARVLTMEASLAMPRTQYRGMPGGGGMWIPSSSRNNVKAQQSGSIFHQEQQRQFTAGLKRAAQRHIQTSALKKRPHHSRPNRKRCAGYRQRPCLNTTAILQNQAVQIIHGLLRMRRSRKNRPLVLLQHLQPAG